MQTFKKGLLFTRDQRYFYFSKSFFLAERSWFEWLFQYACLYVRICERHVHFNANIQASFPVFVSICCHDKKYKNS